MQFRAPLLSAPLAAALVLCLSSAAWPVDGKTKAPAPPPPAKSASNKDSGTQPANPSKAGPDSETPAAAIPDARALSILIRRTLLSLNDANLTGNYTVFRDLAAPGFQAANDASRLTEIFTVLRRRKIDLAPIIYFDPKLVRPATINENGMLRISGFVPTQPEQVNFDMMFQKVANRWRLFGIAVNTTAAQPQAPSLDPAGEAASASAKGAPGEKK